jgi:hypothetical protein
LEEEVKQTPFVPSKQQIIHHFINSEQHKCSLTHILYAVSCGDIATLSFRFGGLDGLVSPQHGTYLNLHDTEIIIKEDFKIKSMAFKTREIMDDTYLFSLTLTDQNEQTKIIEHEAREDFKTEIMELTDSEIIVSARMDADYYWPGTIYFLILDTNTDFRSLYKESQKHDSPYHSL